MTANKRTNGRRPGGLPVCLSLLSLLSLLFFAVIGTTTVASSDAHAAKKASRKVRTDPREMQAREAYAAGRYSEALDLYAKLFAEKLHPTYLRNIGRCHQNMGNPEEAILSFRDYLRKAPKLSASERQEVEGFIREMEELQEQQKQEKERQQAEAQAAVVNPPPPVVAETPQPRPQPAGVNLQPITQPSQPEPKPIYKRAWFWVATGVVVTAAVVGGLWAGGVFDSSNCRAGYDCQ